MSGARKLLESGATPAAKLVGLVLLEQARGELGAWPTLRRSELEALTGLGRPAVRRAIAWLERAGFVTTRPVARRLDS